MINETYKLNIKGNVVTSWTDGFVFKPISSTHNEIMYATADCLAQMYAGQPRKIPAKIGFMFTSESTVPTVPSAKSTTWANLVSMCTTTADIQVVDFSFSPSLTSKNAEGTENYVSNVAVFHGHSDEAVAGEVNGLDIGTNGTKIFGAVLLSSDHTPLSIVPLGNGSTPYLERPTGFELALDWYITFSVDSSPVDPRKTTFHFNGSPDETYLIEGTLDQNKMVELGFGLYNEEEYVWIKEPSSVEVGSAVTSIGLYAFRECGGLMSVTIPSSVTSVGLHAFEDCSGLTSVTIPSSVTSIGDVAFAGCSGLTSAAIPDSVTSIGSYAFESCSDLTSVTIGTAITNIGEYAFVDCTSLMSVTMSGKTMATVQGMTNYPWELQQGCTIHCTDGDITL